MPIANFNVSTSRVSTRFLPMRAALLLCGLIAHVACLVPTPLWENSKWERHVDLYKSYTKEQNTLTITNVAESPVKEYFYALPSNVLESLSVVLVVLPLRGIIVSARPVPADGSSSGFLHLSLPEPLAPGAEVELQLQIVYTGQIIPERPRIAMNDEHWVAFSTHKIAFLAYPTHQYQLTLAGVQSSTLEERSVEAIDPQFASTWLLARNRIEFTPIRATVPAFTLLVFDLVYRREFPLPRVYHLDRSVWISHWGDAVSVEETYELGNDASGLISGFLRIDWMKYLMSQRNSFVMTGLDLITTEGARELYYTDLVGNVLTLFVPEDGHLVVRPRFPVFGGWHYNFTVGWSSPLNNHVKPLQALDEYTARVPLLAGLQDARYDLVELTVVLPEGAEFVHVALPVPYVDKQIHTEYSFLDTSGRVSVTLVFENIVDELRNADVYVQYRYTTAAHWHKPLAVAGFVLTALAGVWLLSKVDVSIDEKVEEELVEVEEEEEDVEVIELTQDELETEQPAKKNKTKGKAKSKK